MDRARNRVESRGRIRERIRRKVTGSELRPRLAIFKSQKHIYAQIIDDAAGVTLAHASSLEGGKGKSGSNKDAAAKVGALIAERAKDKGVVDVVFDRGGDSFAARAGSVQRQRHQIQRRDHSPQGRQGRGKIRIENAKLKIEKNMRVDRAIAFSIFNFQFSLRLPAITRRQ